MGRAFGMPGSFIKSARAMIADKFLNQKLDTEDVYFWAIKKVLHTIPENNSLSLGQATKSSKLIKTNIVDSQWKIFIVCLLRLY